MSNTLLISIETNPAVVAEWDYEHTNSIISTVDPQAYFTT